MRFHGGRGAGFPIIFPNYCDLLIQKSNPYIGVSFHGGRGISLSQEVNFFSQIVCEKYFITDRELYHNLDFDHLKFQVCRFAGLLPLKNFSSKLISDNKVSSFFST